MLKALISRQPCEIHFGCNGLPIGNHPLRVLWMVTWPMRHMTQKKKG